MDAPDTTPLAPPTERFPPAPLAPPTEQGGVAITGPRSLWPNALGVLCIIDASCGALYHAVALIVLIFDSDARHIGPASVQPYERTELWLVATLVNLFLSVGLLVVGIGLARRSSTSAHAARMWSVLKLLAAVIIAIVTHFVVAAYFSKTSGLIGYGDAELTLVLTLLWACITPIILLLWLRRRSIHKEIATWRHPRIAP